MKNTTPTRDDKKSATANRNQMTEFLPASPAASNATAQNSAATNANAQTASAQTTDGTASTATDRTDFSPLASEEQVRTLAYGKWEQAGCPECDGVAFWLEAERDLNQKSGENA